MKSTIFRTAALLFTIAALHDFAPAGVILTDDFESYTTTAQMNAAWNVPPTGAGTLDTLNGHFGNSLFHPGGTTQKRAFTPTIATDSNPIIWEFDLFDSTATNKRLTGGLRDNAGGNPANAILEMGRFNSVYHPETGATVDAYAIRTVFLGGPADANGWLTFYNPNTGSFQPRVAGWNHFRAEIGDTNINWSLDIGANGSFDAFRSTPLSAGTGRLYDVARFGGPSDVASGGGSLNFDNLLVRQAETVTLPWDVTVTGGPHSGSTGNGSFTYSDRSLDAHGNGVVTPTNGNLSLSLSLFGQSFDQTHDQAYDSTPNLYVQNFAPQYLDYNVDETSSFNPVPINEPNVRAIHASNFLAPNGGGGYHQDITVEDYPLPPIVLDNGSLRVAISRTNGSINQILFGGSDFYNAGTAVSDWGMQVDTDASTFARNTTQLSGEFSGIPVSTAAVGDAAVVTGTYAPGGGVEIGIKRTYSLVPGQNVLRVTMEFANNGIGVTIAGFDTFDPDQGFDHGNGFSTFNDVSSVAEIGATFAEASDLDGLSVVIGSLDNLATIASGYPFAIDSGFTLNDLFTAPYDDNGSFDDYGTHVAIRRFLASGGSFTFIYDQAYGLTASDALNQFTTASVPEPSTLIIASIAALGLTHWRRRK